MTQQIIELVRELGCTSEQEEGLVCALCEAAGRELTDCLKEGVSPADCGQAFVVAGAWIALAGLEVSRGSGQVQSFRAGDVTVQSGDACSKAGQLRRQAMELMARWTKDRKFLFYGVKSL